MSEFGAWEVNVNASAMPERIATAVSGLNDMVGAEYKPIAYLGSQLVNGTNHAVLAEQTLITGKDQKNVVLVIFRQVGDEVTLSNIERVLTGGMDGQMGAVEIKATTDIPAEAKAAFEATLSGFVGMDVKPFAFLGTQVVKGINYFFACETKVVAPEGETNVAIVTANPLTKDVDYNDIL